MGLDQVVDRLVHPDDQPMVRDALAGVQTEIHYETRVVQPSGETVLVSVYAELGRRRPGAEVDDDTFVALEHAGGTISHLWASSVAARPGPRFRVLGSDRGYEVAGMDPQEQALTDGKRPGADGWGVSPPSRSGTLGIGDDVAAVPTEPGDYGRFYEGIVAAFRDGPLMLQVSTATAPDR